MAGFGVAMEGQRIESLHELLALMHRTLSGFDAARDHRAAFLRVYATMTESVKEHAARPFFCDPAWVERVAIRFAACYYDALHRFEAGGLTPPPWCVAFTVAQRREGFLLQDILLGMNAHINHDLPFVVAEILREEGDAWEPIRSTRRRFDHDQINRVLFQVIPRVERAVADQDGRLLLPLGRLLGRLDQSLAAYGLTEWRDHVWQKAAFLLAAATQDERQRVVDLIEQEALQVARQILNAPPLRWFQPLAPYGRRLRLF